MKVFFLPSYVSRAPSTRMRVYKVAEFLQKLNQPLEILPYNLTIEEKHKRLASVQSGDILYVQKWRTEFNAVEHLQRYKGKCKLIFDMDDHTGDPQALELIKLADALVVGNHFLYNLYKNQNKPCFIVPTPVDLDEYPKFAGEGSLSISLAKCGIGPQMGALKKLKESLCQLHQEYGYILILAGFDNGADTQVARGLFSFAQCLPLRTYECYLKETVPILQRTTVGISPFTKKDNGKSGHSVLANLAMGVPCVTTKFAECEYIIQDGVNGFLVESGDWYNVIKRVFDSPELRSKVRQAGWDTIRSKYDTAIIANKLSALFARMKDEI